MTVYGNNDADRALLNEMGLGLFSTAVFALFQNNLVVGRTTLLGDLVVADYDGYATEAITWATASISDNNVPEAIGVAGEFRPTGGTTPNTIYGGFIMIPTAGPLPDRLYRVFNFDAPIEMSVATDSLVLTARLRLAPDGSLIVVVS